MRKDTKERLSTSKCLKLRTRKLEKMFSTFFCSDEYL